MSHHHQHTKDLTKVAATSPRHRTGGYVILSRMADKIRADIAGKMGAYHTDCPLDRVLLEWKGVQYADVRKKIESGASDEELAAYLDANGIPRSHPEVASWSDRTEKATIHGDSEKGPWFDRECEALGLEPSKTSTFDWLEADDRASFGK